MRRNVLFIILVIGLSNAKDEATEDKCKNTGSCQGSALRDQQQDEEFSIITRRIQKAVAGYEPCSSDPDDANCTCYEAVLNRDLKPFTSTGLTKKMLQEAAKFGTRYKIYNKRLFRDESCMFPARCQGIEHFLLQLLPELPDMDIVINTRDYPQHSTWSKGGPVLSFSKTKDYRDIMYPAWTFWAGGPATKLHPTGIGRWDLMREKLEKSAAKIPWAEKQELGFFRGSRTSEERDSLILLSRRKPELVEAQYTRNQAWKSPKDTLNKPPADEVTFEDHCKYKYLFNFRGVAASFRLKHLFLCNSLVFHVGDEWQEFFYDQLKPWVHYVPLPSNPSQQQYEQLLEYFKLNDALARQIAQRGRDFIWQHLRMQDIKCYWRNLLTRYAKLLKYPVQADPQMILIGGHKDEL